jgi:hypothetical protein
VREAKENQELLGKLNMSAFAGANRYQRLRKQKTSDGSDEGDDTMKNGYECLESSFSEDKEAKSEMRRGRHEQPMEVQLMQMDNDLKIHGSNNRHQSKLMDLTM